MLNIKENMTLIHNDFSLVSIFIYLSKLFKIQKEDFHWMKVREVPLFWIWPTAFLLAFRIMTCAFGLQVRWEPQIQEAMESFFFLASLSMHNINISVTSIVNINLFLKVLRSLKMKKRRKWHSGTKGVWNATQPRWCLIS